jgi:hypothetical protein
VNKEFGHILPLKKMGEQIIRTYLTLKKIGEQRILTCLTLKKMGERRNRKYSESMGGMLKPGLINFARYCRKTRSKFFVVMLKLGRLPTGDLVQKKKKKKKTLAYYPFRHLVLKWKIKGFSFEMKKIPRYPIARLQKIRLEEEYYVEVECKKNSLCNRPLTYCDSHKVSLTAWSVRCNLL